MNIRSTVNRRELTNHSRCYISSTVYVHEVMTCVVLKGKTLGEKAGKFPLLINQPYITIVYKFYSWLDPKIDNYWQNLGTGAVFGKKMTFGIGIAIAMKGVRDAGFSRNRSKNAGSGPYPPPPPPPPLQTLFKISWDVANTEEKLQQDSQKFDHL